MTFQTHSRALNYLAVAVITALIVVVFYHFVDLPVARYLKAVQTESVSDIFDIIDQLGTSEIYLIPALLLYVWSLVAVRQGWRPPCGLDFAWMTRASLFLMLTMAAGGIVTALLKNVVARARPELLIEQGIYGLATPFTALSKHNSFPSSHTQAAFAAAWVFALLAPRWRWIFLAAATSVAAARVVNLDHYLSDVIAASVIAGLAAFVLAPLIMAPDQTWPLRTPWRWGRKA